MPTPTHTPTGGWDLSGVSTCFDYLLNMPKTLRRVGRFLAGFPFDRVTGFAVVMEDLDAMDPDHRDYSEDFVTNVGTLKELIYGNYELEPMVVSTLLATFIKDTPQIKEKEGDIHLPLRMTMACCLQCNIEAEHYNNISRELGQKWLTLNTHGLTIAQVRASTEGDDAGQLRLENTTLLSHVKELSAIIMQMSARLTGLEAMMRVVVQSSPSKQMCRPSKRKLDNDVSVTPKRKLDNDINATGAQETAYPLIVAPSLQLLPAPTTPLSLLPPDDLGAIWEGARKWSLACAYDKLIRHKMTTKASIKANIGSKYEHVRSDLKKLVLFMSDPDIKKQVDTLHTGDRDGAWATTVATLATTLERKAMLAAQANLDRVKRADAESVPTSTVATLPTQKKKKKTAPTAVFNSVQSITRALGLKSKGEKKKKK